MSTLSTRALMFGGVTVCVEHSAGRAAEIVEFLFKRIPHADGTATPAASARLCLVERPTDVFTLTSGGELRCTDRSAGAVASWLLHLTCRQLASSRANGLMLHAAAVQRHGQGILLAGASGSGKTTLTGFLTSRGFGHLTDEVAFMPADSLQIEGFAVPLKLKKPGVEALSDHVSLQRGSPRVLFGRHDVLFTPRGSRSAPAAVPLSLIVFPTYVPNSRFRLQALTPAQTGLRLMTGVLNAKTLPDHGFSEVARVATLVPGYEMRYGSLGQVAANLERLRRMTPPRRRKNRPVERQEERLAGENGMTPTRTRETIGSVAPLERTDGAGPELTAYRLHHASLPLVLASASRDWMDATDERYAYRCLPLLIANQAGWFVLNEQPFEVIWDGRRALSGVRIRQLDKGGPPPTVSSHFGDGIITFHIPYLFRTSPGYNLLVRGPSNWPKDGVQALEGLVESDWTSATFTMNWKITRPKRWLRFQKGEPICMLVPQRRGELEAFHPGIADLSSNAELNEAHKQWADSRAKFLAALRVRKPEAVNRKWQKDYFQGRSPGGTASDQHQTVLHLRSFTAEGTENGQE